MVILKEDVNHKYAINICDKKCDYENIILQSDTHLFSSLLLVYHIS